jgi:predicted  nucleic acid-binding Zn-ribbon protein
LRLYERVRAGRTNTVLAAVTQDGACGHCFNMIPIQEQAEIRRGETLGRCEACGVILYPES